MMKTVSSMATAQVAVTIHLRYRQTHQTFPLSQLSVEIGTIASSMYKGEYNRVDSSSANIIMFLVSTTLYLFVCIHRVSDLPSKSW